MCCFRLLKSFCRIHARHWSQIWTKFQPENLRSVLPEAVHEKTFWNPSGLRLWLQLPHLLAYLLNSLVLACVLFVQESDVAATLQPWFLAPPRKWNGNDDRSLPRPHRLLISNNFASYRRCITSVIGTVLLRNPSNHFICGIWMLYLCPSWMLYQWQLLEFLGWIAVDTNHTFIRSSVISKRNANHGAALPNELSFSYPWPNKQQHLDTKAYRFPVQWFIGMRNISTVWVARCTREIKSGIAMVKAAFSKNYLFTSKLDLKFKERTSEVPHLEHSILWCWDVDIAESRSEIPGRLWN
jgi:hypothetical protein